MDLGGGPRLRRRPRSCLFKCSVQMVLLFFPPFSISILQTGDSATEARAHLHPPFMSLTISSARTQGRSPPAQARGGIVSSSSWTNYSDLSPLELASSPHASVGRLCFIFYNSEASIVLRSGFEELWLHILKFRSEAYTRCLTLSDSLNDWKFQGPYSSRSTSLIQLSKLCFQTNSCLISPSPIVRYSQAFGCFSRTGFGHNRHCISCIERYNFLKLIVLNLLTKLFLWNFELIHGTDGVPDSAVAIVLSSNLSDWRLVSIYDRVCYRRCAALLSSSRISFEGTFDDMQRLEPLSMLCKVTKVIIQPESYWSSIESLAALLSFVGKLGRTALLKLGLRPCFYLSAMLTYPVGHEANFQSSQVKWNQMGLKFSIRIWTSVLLRVLFLMCFCKVEPPNYLEV